MPEPRGAPHEPPSCAWKSGLSVFSCDRAAGRRGPPAPPPPPAAADAAGGAAHPAQPGEPGMPLPRPQSERLEELPRPGDAVTAEGAEEFLSAVTRHQQADDDAQGEQSEIHAPSDTRPARSLTVRQS